MIRQTTFCSLALLICLGFTGCPTTQSDFSAENLNGHWKGNFEKTWKISKAEFMKDTLRGENAYPKDQAEKEKIVKGEVEPLIGQMEYLFTGDNEFQVLMDGREQASGTFEFEKTSNRQLKLEMATTPKKSRFSKDGKTNSRKVNLEVKFQNRDSIEVTMQGVTIVYDRQDKE